MQLKQVQLKHDKELEEKNIEIRHLVLQIRDQEVRSIVYFMPP